MLKNISGVNRTRRTAVSPKVMEVREEYARLALHALLRSYPSQQDFTAEICLLDAGDKLELFWSILELGGPAPGGWHQVLDLKLVFERACDGAKVTTELDAHIAKLETDMRESARKFEFEKAARLRDSIKELRDKEFLFG